MDVVFAFERCRETCYPPELPEGGKILRPSSKQLMGISLMTDIEHDAIPWAIHQGMQGHDRFDSSQAGGKMPAILGGDGNHLFPQLGAEDFQFVIR